VIDTNRRAATAAALPGCLVIQRLDLCKPGLPLRRRLPDIVDEATIPS
jgi:hypothetical protein